MTAVVLVCFHVHVSLLVVIPAAWHLVMAAMSSVAVHEVHQRAGQQHEVGPVAQDMSPVFAEQEEGGN
jgi:hypothetical protein